jgi:hypoxanthine phosphoribosyltransferase
MNLISYNWTQTNTAIQDIAMSMYKDKWRPDYIVGITRGGLVPAVLLSHMVDIPMHTLCVQLGTDGLEENTESNCWMAEDAFGYEKEAKNILIIDDINRGGDAMAWIMKDWQASCLPTSENWDQVWHNNVRFASLLSNPNSIVDTDYFSVEFDDELKQWIQFPWET